MGGGGGQLHGSMVDAALSPVQRHQWGCVDTVTGTGRGFGRHLLWPFAKKKTQKNRMCCWRQGRAMSHPMGLKGSRQNATDGHLPGVWHHASQDLRAAAKRTRENRMLTSHVSGCGLEQFHCSQFNMQRNIDIHSMLHSVGVMRL